MFYIYMNHLKRTSNDISFGYFMLTLDWLYLLNLVELTENGDIKNVIKNLKIFSNGIEIRNIPFKTGLNLILDNETILELNLVIALENNSTSHCRLLFRFRWALLHKDLKDNTLLI